MKKKILDFEKQPRKASLKTEIWEVWNTLDVVLLGTVKWFGRWRQYAFFPQAGLVFERNCLRTIADFCEAQSKEHRCKK